MVDTVLIASWLAFMATIFVFVGLDLLREPDKSFVRKITGMDTDEKWWKTISEQIGPGISAWFPVVNMENIKKKLTWAGVPWGLTPEGFMGLKILAFIIMILAGIALSLFGFPLILVFVLGGIAFTLPDYLLTNLADKRKQEIRKNLPDMLGLLATAIGAGLEPGPALRTVGDKMPGAIGIELRRVWRETATGKPRATALREMAKRTGVDTVERFTETMITAEERGSVDLSISLVNFQKDIRATQVLKAQEQARKIPNKMALGPLLIIIMGMLGMMIAPIAFMLSDTLS